MTIVGEIFFFRHQPPAKYHRCCRQKPGINGIQRTLKCDASWYHKSGVYVDPAGCNSSNHHSSDHYDGFPDSLGLGTYQQFYRFTSRSHTPCSNKAHTKKASADSILRYRESLPEAIHFQKPQSNAQQNGNQGAYDQRIADTGQRPISPARIPLIVFSVNWVPHLPWPPPDPPSCLRPVCRSGVLY